MSHLALFLLGSPRIERDGVLINFDTRKAIALIAYLAVTRQRHSRDALANLLWPEYDQVHARATLRRTLSALNKSLEGDWLRVDREMIGLNPHSSLWLDVENFQNLLAECRTHGHSPAEICPACLHPLTEAVKLYRDDFLAGFSLRDSPNFDDWQFFQADSQRRTQATALEHLVQCYSALGDFDSAIPYARRWLALDRLHEPAHRQLMQLYTWVGQRAAALHQYRECVQVLEQELGVAPLEATTQLYQAIKENQAPPPPVQRATVPSPTAPSPLTSTTMTPTRGVTTFQGAPLLAPESPKAPTPLTPIRGVNTVHSAPLPAPELPTATSNYPLVGRSEEWATLLRAYEAIDTDGQIVILEGEAGIGKTRLAEEFLAHVQGKGATVVAARCYEGETNLAYGPIVAGLRAAIAQKENVRWLEKISTPWLSEAARLLPELATLRQGLPPAPPLDSPGAQSHFFEGLRQLLLALCSSPAPTTPTRGVATFHAPMLDSPGVIFFDDVHWADGASLDLLSYMVRRLHGQPLCLFITWRNKQAAGDPRLRHLLIEAQRSGKATIVSLPRLSRSTVQELVQFVAPAVATSSVMRKGIIERLYQETEGLPFFLVEYLTAIVKGMLTTTNDAWSLPGGVRDLLRSRLVAVGEAAWQLLNTAAVIGRSFDFDTLKEASGRSEEETVTALEELIAQGLVEEVRSGVSERAPTYDFSHEKLRALVYEETSLARRRLLHRRVAEVLVSSMRRHRENAALAGQIAHHYELAGNEPAAAEYYRQAGEHARNLYANAEALTHFHRALALGHSDTAALHEAIGDLHTLLGEYSAALKSYETAAALCALDALVNIEHKLGTVYQRRGEWERAESHLEAALQALGENSPASERAKVYADWSLTAHHRGRVEQARDLAQQALHLAEAASDTHALAQAHNILGILASSQGDSERARSHLERSLALAESLNDPSIRAAALNNLALAYRASGDVEQALTLTETALALCVSQGDRHREAALHSNLADLLHAAGRSQEAMDHLKQSVSIYAEIGVEAGTFQPEIWKLTEW